MRRYEALLTDLQKGDWKMTHLERLSSPESRRATHHVLGMTDTKQCVKGIAVIRRDLFH